MQNSTKRSLKLCNHLAEEERAYCFDCDFTDLNVLAAVLLCLPLGVVVYDDDISCSDSLAL